MQGDEKHRWVLPEDGLGDALAALLGLVEIEGLVVAELVDALDAAFYDPGVRAVLMEVDTPGGEVGGLFDLVETIRAAIGQSGTGLTI